MQATMAWPQNISSREGVNQRTWYVLGLEGWYRRTNVVSGWFSSLWLMVI